MGFNDYIDVLGDTQCITVVGEHLRGEVDNVKRVDPAATKLEIIYERLGGDVGADGLGVPEPADPCVFGSVSNEGLTAAFGGFAQIEIVPQ